MRSVGLSLLLCFLIPGPAAAEGRLRLKAFRTPLAEASQEPAPPKRRAGGRSHILLQFRSAPKAAQLGQLRRRGISLIGYVPDDGFVALAPDDSRFDGLDLVRAGRMPAGYKVSPLLARARPGATDAPETFIVEFHPDVGIADARAIVAEERLALGDHPDLLRGHLLVRGSRDRARRLADWDEVAYVFPASADLLSGKRVRACGGAVSPYGPIGQYTDLMGEGWDGPGREPADLGYIVSGWSGRLSRQEIESVVSNALAEWAKYVELRFLPSSRSGMNRSLDFLFAPRSHGDAYPFDGHGGVLAHSFYPAPPNPEPIAGDVHVDDDEDWGSGPEQKNLYSVVLHEIGHALGLGHSDQPGAVMYPYYRGQIAGLHAEDVAAIREIYAPWNSGDGPMPDPPPDPLTLIVEEPSASGISAEQTFIQLRGRTEGGSGEISVSWETDRGYSGVADGGREWIARQVPLEPGYNTITATARDQGGDESAVSLVVTRTEPGEVSRVTLAIQSPAFDGDFVTPSDSIALAGVAVGPGGIDRIVWASARGASGEAAGKEAWSTGPIPLETGRNAITVTAYAVRGGSASQTVAVQRTDGADTAPPALQITTPAMAAVSTASDKIRLSGTASDDTGVVEVTWEDTMRNAGVAEGAERWTTGDIALRQGVNRITVWARDAAGNRSWRTIVVTRSGIRRGAVITSQPVGGSR